jgi:hypothetical protein
MSLIGLKSFFRTGIALRTVSSLHSAPRTASSHAVARFGISAIPPYAILTSTTVVPFKRNQ